MRSLFVGGLTALVALLSCTADLSAKVAAPPAVAVITARADAVVVGKIVRIEDKLVRTPDGAELSVAVVQVGTSVIGTKDVKQVRVAFYQGENRRFPHLNLKVGQEAVFYLHAVSSKEPLYGIPSYWDVMNTDNPLFATQLEEAKRYAKAIENPLVGLKSTDAQERLLTAGLLVTHYRGRTDGAATQVPIDAVESKLILEILAANEWNARPEQMPTASPAVLFQMLRLEAKDGWQVPTDLNTVPAAAQKWLRDNAGTYRIKRLVLETR